jgi:predicted nucleic acid-binding protein
MSAEKAFIDTNVFVYLYSNSEPEKKRRAAHAINEFDRFVSTQVLNEFCNVGIRKLKLPLSAVRTAIGEICDVETRFFRGFEFLGVSELEGVAGWRDGGAVDLDAVLGCRGRLSSVVRRPRLTRVDARCSG